MHFLLRGNANPGIAVDSKTWDARILPAKPKLSHTYANVMELVLSQCKHMSVDKICQLASPDIPVSPNKDQRISVDIPQGVEHNSHMLQFTDLVFCWRSKRALWTEKLCQNCGYKLKEREDKCLLGKTNHQVKNKKVLSLIKESGSFFYSMKVSEDEDMQEDSNDTTN